MIEKIGEIFLCRRQSNGLTALLWLLRKFPINLQRISTAGNLRDPLFMLSCKVCVDLPRKKSGCAHLYYSFSSNKSVSSSQALMREPATVSFTSYHFPVSTLPGRVTNRFLLSPIVCSIACCVLPSQPKFSQQ